MKKDNITEQCESYSKRIGCYHTFDGKCGKENCQKYRLMKENEELKQKLEQLECKNCSKRPTMLDIITDESEE